MRRRAFFTFLVVLAVASPEAEVQVRLPNKDGSLRMAIIGDTGTGSRSQYEVGSRLAEARQAFPFEIVLMLGDNMYGGERPQDFAKKFEKPYRPLLDAGVKFYAALGNHDDRDQRLYKLFNMNGELYYTFKAPKQDVRFFVLESSYMDRKQLDWLERQLQNSTDAWKIVYMHHPLYSSGNRHGSSTSLREVLEPLFIKYNVSVAFAGHEHFYERIKPQNGIAYFTAGGSAKLRKGNIEDRSPLTAKGFDTDNSFMLAEIDGDEMHFQTISRTGETVDEGVVRRRKEASALTETVRRPLR
jgi:calcineurin-like phosphoesterase family protein